MIKKKTTIHRFIFRTVYCIVEAKNTYIFQRSGSVNYVKNVQKKVLGMYFKLIKLKKSDFIMKFKLFIYVLFPGDPPKTNY